VTCGKSMDTSSGPYFEQPYPYNLSLNYGRSDYNVGKSFKLYGMWQPVIFHGSNSWMEKIVGGWSLSGIFTLHSGFPWSPVVSVQGGSLYCGTCGYGALLDRKSTRLNSSHEWISYAVFCLKKKISRRFVGT